MKKEKEHCIVDYINTSSGEIISIYKNGHNPNTNLYYYFRYKGIRYQGSCGSKDLETSKNKSIEIFFEITKGIRYKGRKKKFEDIVDDFISMKNKEVENDKLSPKTFIEYQRQSRFIKEWYKDISEKKPINMNIFFSESRYKDYCEWRKQYYTKKQNKKIQKYTRDNKLIKGRTYNKVEGTTLNRECRLLCSILRHGKKEKHILLDNQIPPFSKDYMSPEKIRKEVFQYGEYDKLKSYWTKKNPFFWYCITTINNCGLRPGELAKIKWGDVHLKEGYILIRKRKNKNRTKEINSPVPIIGSTTETLETLKSRENIPTGNNNYVFVNDKNYLVNIPYLSKQFRNSVKEIIGKNMTLYNLRHNYITRMIKRRIPIKIISDVVGHTSTDMINKHYSHLFWEDYVYQYQQSEKRIRENLKTRKKEERTD